MSKKALTWDNLPEHLRALLRVRLGDAVVEDLRTTKAGSCDLLFATTYTLFGANKLIHEEVQNDIVRNFFPEIWPVEEKEDPLAHWWETSREEENKIPLLAREKELLDCLYKYTLRHLAFVLLKKEKPLPAKSSFLKMLKNVDKVMPYDHPYVQYAKKCEEEFTKNIEVTLKNYIKNK